MESSDTPAIYAGDSKPMNIFVKLTTFVVVTFALFAIVSAVVLCFVDKRPIHLFSAVVLAVFMIALFIIVKWYRNYDLPPKFKFVLFMLVATVVLCTLVVVVYVYDRPAPNPIAGCVGMYNVQTKECLKVAQPDYCSTGYCMFMVSPDVGCCALCTQTADQCMAGNFTGSLSAF